MKTEIPADDRLPADDQDKNNADIPKINQFWTGSNETVRRFWDQKNFFSVLDYSIETYFNNNINKKNPKICLENLPKTIN